MSVVVVERSFPEPAVFEALHALEEGGAWCLEAHHVRHLKSYFSRDRRRMICLYEAPDAEAVRLVHKTTKVPLENVWTARVVDHEAPEAHGDAILVERMLPQPMDEAAIHEAAARGAWCLEKYGCRIVRSYLSGDGRRAACVFGGPDAESVRQTQKETGMTCDRVWPATVHEPPPPPR